MKIRQVIVVENEEFNASYIKKNVERFGYVVLEIFTNYEDTINYIKSNENIDLILININLKAKEDGIETIKDIKKIKDIPFIYMSNDMDDKTIERAFDTKPLSILYRPFKFYQIKASLSLVDHKLETGQLSNTREFKY